jgi:hypothetical protein
VIASLSLVACAATRQPRKPPDRAGFLGDYSMLEPGGDDAPALMWVRTDVDWSVYNAVMIDSIQFWHAIGTAELPKPRCSTL